MPVIAATCAEVYVGTLARAATTSFACFASVNSLFHTRIEV